jgi:phage shock protein A
MDPVIHAKMTALVREENDLKEEADKLDDEIPLWEGRVKLANDKGMSDLARQASERVDELKARKAEIKTKLDVIKMDKDMLRYESKRPSGDEVRRAEAMVESVRLGGLIDPDEASLERELKDLEKKNIQFDFNDDEG